MLLSQWVDIKRLENLIEDKYVTARHHPTHPLVILNYSSKAVEIREWDSTLSRCRGLVYDTDTLQIVAIPFSKFWSYNDAGHPETLQENLPTGVPAIYEKVDGSLGVGFFYKGKFIIATRGSFESDQAKWAQAWVDDRISYEEIGPIDRIFTFLFEIVASFDKKVVDYPFSGLVLLGETDFQGRSYRPDLTVLWFLKDVRIAKQLSYEELDKLQARNSENEEGYVVTWFKGVNTLRVKLKFETYKLLHRMYFQTTPLVIWEWCKSGYGADKISEQLKGADITLIDWALGIATQIWEDYHNLKHDADIAFRDAIQKTNWEWDLDAPEKERRKTFAFFATQFRQPQLLFLAYDGKITDRDEAIWKAVKPSNSDVWRKEEE